MGKISSVFLVDSNRPRGFCGVFFRVLVFFLTVVVVLLRLDVVVENGLSNIPLVIVPLQKRLSINFLCLSRACLGKCSVFWYKLARKKAFPHRAVHQSMMPEHHVACMPKAVNGRETGIFLEFSLCLSRACLGKMIVFIYKWRKNAVFRRARWVESQLIFLSGRHTVDSFIGCSPACPKQSTGAVSSLICCSCLKYLLDENKSVIHRSKYRGKCYDGIE